MPGGMTPSSYMGVPPPGAIAFAASAWQWGQRLAVLRFLPKFRAKSLFFRSDTPE